MMTAVRLVLASSSPRRAELLEAAGFTFDTLAVDIDETVRPGEQPAAYVRRLALEKSARAQAILSIAQTGQVGQVGQVGRVGQAETVGLMGQVGVRHDEQVPLEDLVILGADTTVVVDGEILGKPCDAADAERMLRCLSCRRHEVMTGVSLRRNERELGSVETTTVDFMRLSEADVAWYCGSAEGRDKAGGYAIQGLASRFITRIEGSYTNVVGLPVAVVSGLLQRLASAG
jgi:septum formation protein